MKSPKFPQFDSYACVGDTIKWESQGFDLTATLVQDTDTHVNDSECYSAAKINQWKNDEWFFVGVVLSVSRNGVEISDHAASLWGVDCNYNKKSNKYLAEVAQELETEALTEARERATKMVAALID